MSYRIFPRSLLETATCQDSRCSGLKPGASASPLLLQRHGLRRTRFVTLVLNLFHSQLRSHSGTPHPLACGHVATKAAQSGPVLTATRRGMSPGRQAGVHGFSPCFFASIVVHPFYRRSRFRTFPGRPEDGSFRCRQHGWGAALPLRQAVQVAVAPVPPRRLPRRSRAPAALEGVRSASAYAGIPMVKPRVRHQNRTSGR
jgi:hypothetical protein